GSTIFNQGIALHLTEAKTSFLPDTSVRLTSEELDCASTTSLHLVGDEMAKELIVDRTDIDVDVHLTTGDAVDHPLLTAPCEAEIGELFLDVLNVEAPEGRRRDSLALESSKLTRQNLVELTDGHTTRDAVWIEDGMRPDS